MRSVSSGRPNVSRNGSTLVRYPSNRLLLVPKGSARPNPAASNSLLRASGGPCGRGQSPGHRALRRRQAGSLVGRRHVEGLVLEERLRQRVELAAVLAEERGDLLVGGRHEGPNLLVDEPLRLVRHLGRAREQRP